MTRGPAAKATTRFAAIIVLICSSCRDPNRVEVGRAVPEYSAMTLAGDSVSLASQRSKVVLLNIWATWCHPCRTEIPELISLHDRYKERGFTVIGVTIDAEGSADAIKEFMEEFKMNFPVWHDPDERILTTFMAVGVPSTFLIDKQGVLLWRKLGPVKPGDTTLINAIERSIQ